VTRIVADLGNTRLKWGWVGPDGSLRESSALPIDDPDHWTRFFDAWVGPGSASSWGISSVNPPVARRLEAFLSSRGSCAIQWFDSAAKVPVPHNLLHPETAGADRACAVLAAQHLHPSGGPGIVVSCGTAITVERISVEGRWEGGAIAPGLGVSAQALKRHTAQLPLVKVDEPPPAWGRSTEPAIASGLYWGTVGLIRELVQKAALDLSPRPWLVWTGGDAPLFVHSLKWEESHLIPDLVLMGLTFAAFPQTGQR
jgi:type III pantothenate kinase